MGLENIWKRTTRQISVSLRHWLNGRCSLLHFDGGWPSVPCRRSPREYLPSVYLNNYFHTGSFPTYLCCNCRSQHFFCQYGVAYLLRRLTSTHILPYKAFSSLLPTSIRISSNHVRSDMTDAAVQTIREDMGLSVVVNLNADFLRALVDTTSSLKHSHLLSIFAVRFVAGYCYFKTVNPDKKFMGIIP